MYQKWLLEEVNYEPPSSCRYTSLPFRPSFCRKTTMLNHQKRTHQIFSPTDALGESWDRGFDSTESFTTSPQPSGDIWPIHVLPSQRGLDQGSATSLSCQGRSLIQPHGASAITQNMQQAATVDSRTLPTALIIDVGPDRSRHIEYQPDQVDTVQQECYSSSEPSDQHHLNLSASTMQNVVAPDDHAPSPLSTVSFQSSHYRDDSCSGQTDSSANSSFYEVLPIGDEQCTVPFASAVSQAVDGSPGTIPYSSQETGVAGSVGEYQHMPASMGVTNWGPYYASGQFPAYGQLMQCPISLYDLYAAPKLDFVDPSMQLPSARLDDL